MDGGGVSQGVWEVSHACVHVHTHMCMSNDVIMGIPWGNPLQPMGAAICMKLSCLYMSARAHTCVHAHAHMHRASPNTLTEFHHHPFTPTPQRGMPEISQKSIKIKRIEIFEFCLKILDL